MPDFHRFLVPGGMYFFTVITQDRRPALSTAVAGRDKTGLGMTRKGTLVGLAALDSGEKVWACGPALRPRMPWHAVCGRTIMVRDTTAPCCRDRRGKLPMVRSNLRPGPFERGTLRRSRVGLPVLVFSAFCLGAVAPSAAIAAAADLAEVEKLFRTGQYDQCAALAAQQISKDEETERFSELKIKAELAQGKYAAAVETLETALRQVPSSLALRLLARDVYRSSGHDAAGEDELKTIEQMILAAPSASAGPKTASCSGAFS